MGGATGSIYLKKPPSDYVCGHSTKESSSLLSSSEIGAPIGGGSYFVLGGIISALEQIFSSLECVALGSVSA